MAFNSAFDIRRGHNDRFLPSRAIYRLAVGIFHLHGIQVIPSHHGDKRGPVLIGLIVEAVGRHSVLLFHLQMMKTVAPGRAGRREFAGFAVAMPAADGPIAMQSVTETA